MRCYYEVLGVRQDASDEELRKSYRRLALQFHPDKNPNDVETAKTKFQEVQSAYEVLSDPQERAFYDRNRESILHAEEFGSGPKEDNLHLYKYFRASCFSGFDDSETGFYTVYRRLFEEITAKDLHYIEKERKIPNFGRSDTNLEDVALFYGYWQSYCTAMSFYWVDIHDIRGCSTRWMEKKIEKENKKVRDKAKKEFNEEVRSLVSFVQKRDKRWEAKKKQTEERNAENLRKQTEEQLRRREEWRLGLQESIEEQKKSLSQYEKELKAMESKFAEEWGISEESQTEGEETDSDDVELIANNLFCIACEKLFKSVKAFENHEQSRKHQENKAELASFMQEEEENFTTQEHNDKEQEKFSDSGGDEEVLIASSSKKKKKKKGKTSVNHVEESVPMETNSRRKKNRNDDLTHLLEPVTKERTSEDLKPNQEPPETPNQNYQSENDTKEVNVQQLPTVDDPSGSLGQTDEEKTPAPKLKGKKAKEAKKKVQQQKPQRNVDSSAQGEATTCSVCQSRFPSKNKLFAHLNATGHAAYKTPDNVKAKSKR